MDWQVCPVAEGGGHPWVLLGTWNGMRLEVGNSPFGLRWGLSLAKPTHRSWGCQQALPGFFTQNCIWRFTCYPRLTSRYYLSLHARLSLLSQNPSLPPSATPRLFATTFGTLSPPFAKSKSYSNSPSVVSPPSSLLSTISHAATPNQTDHQAVCMSANHRAALTALNSVAVHSRRVLGAPLQG